MANPTTIRVSKNFLLILFCHLIISRGTSYNGVETSRKKIDNRRILRELGFDFGSETKDTGRREMVDTDRVAPGGPDPQHHHEPPTLS